MRMSKLKVKRSKVRTHLLYCDKCGKRVQKGTKGIFITEEGKEKALLHESCVPDGYQHLITEDEE